MKAYYITFRSVTHAQKGERVLTSAGIRCNLQRTPRWMEERGCGYCLKLKDDRAGEAVERIRSRNIPMRKLYFQGETGPMEEVPL